MVTDSYVSPSVTRHQRRILQERAAFLRYRIVPLLSQHCSKTREMSTLFDTENRGFRTPFHPHTPSERPIVGTIFGHNRPTVGPPLYSPLSPLHSPRRPDASWPSPLSNPSSTLDATPRTGPSGSILLLRVGRSPELLETLDGQGSRGFVTRNPSGIRPASGRIERRERPGRRKTRKSRSRELTQYRTRNEE